MTNRALKFEALRAELPPIVRRDIDNYMTEAFSRINTHLNIGLGLMDVGSKLASSNIESSFTAARIAMDGWKNLAESNARSCQLAFACGSDMSHNIMTAAQMFDSWNKSLDNWNKLSADSHESAPAAIIDQAMMFSRTLVHAAQDMTRQWIEPLATPVAKAGMAKDNVGDGSGQQRREEAHA